MEPSELEASFDREHVPAPEPSDPDGFIRAGASSWAIAAWRELDDAILHLRVNEPEIGLVLLRTSGDGENVLAVDRAVSRLRQKIEPDPRNPRFLRTVHGDGYILTVEEMTSA